MLRRGVVGKCSKQNICCKKGCHFVASTFCKIDIICPFDSQAHDLSTNLDVIFITIFVLFLHSQLTHPNT